MATTFPLFPNLPTELRLEIWQHHFANCHGTQVHIFHSTPNGPQYTNQDATTGKPGYDTLTVAENVGDEAARVAFRAAGFRVGNTGCVQPESYLHDASGQLVDDDDDDEDDDGSRNSGVGNSDDDDDDDEQEHDKHDLQNGISTSNSRTKSSEDLRALYAAAARQELRRRAVRFAVGLKDVVYIVDEKTTPIFISLCRASWFRHSVRRVAFQILNFNSRPIVSRDRGENGNGNGTLLGVEIRQWRGGPSRALYAMGNRAQYVRWDEMLSHPRVGVRRFLTSPLLERVMIVVVPKAEGRSRACSELGNDDDDDDMRVSNFVDILDLELCMLGSAREDSWARERGAAISSCFGRAFPNLLEDGDKISCVVDVMPERAGFSIYP